MVGGGEWKGENDKDKENNVERFRYTDYNVVRV